jgi:hypothetical protein
MQAHTPLPCGFDGGSGRGRFEVAGFLRFIGQGLGRRLEVAIVGHGLIDVVVRLVGIFLDHAETVARAIRLRFRA